MRAILQLAFRIRAMQTAWSAGKPQWNCGGLQPASNRSLTTSVENKADAQAAIERRSSQDRARSSEGRWVKDGGATAFANVSQPFAECALCRNDDLFEQDAAFKSPQ